MTDSKSPAMGIHDGRSVSVQLGGFEHHHRNPEPLALQLALSRDAEHRIRAALTLRGGERLRAIAIAACLRDASFRAGVSLGVQS